MRNSTLRFTASLLQQQKEINEKCKLTHDDSVNWSITAANTMVVIGLKKAQFTSVPENS